MARRVIKIAVPAFFPGRRLTLFVVAIVVLLVFAWSFVF